MARRGDGRPARVLAIGGSDSGGGAGVQADIKTITLLGGYAACALTAVTVQNTLGVQSVHLIPADIVEAQARAVLDDIGADGIKIGMLGAASTVAAVARVLASAPYMPTVIDPVMIAKGGARLLAEDALETFRREMIPRATLLTPNAPEAEVLGGVRVRTTDDLRRAADRLLAAGAGAVLMKGGHVEGDRVIDLLITPGGETLFEGGRILGRHTHGTGCTLAAGCATGLAQGLTLEAAAARAWRFTRAALEAPPGFGAGHGPLGHGAAAALRAWD